MQLGINLDGICNDNVEKNYQKTQKKIDKCKNILYLWRKKALEKSNTRELSIFLKFCLEIQCNLNQKSNSRLSWN